MPPQVADTSGTGSSGNIVYCPINTGSHLPLSIGEVLEFRDLHCVIIEVEEDVPKGTMQERVNCRIIGHSS